jgi:PAS domain S-box-containing protein
MENDTLYQKNQELINKVMELKSKEDSLRLSEAICRQIINVIHTGLISIDRTGSITFINPHTTELLGYYRTDMLGSYLMNYISEKNREIIQQYFTKCPKRSPVQYEIEFKHKDGRIIETLFNISPVYKIDNQYDGSVICINDITELKKRFRQI